MPRPATPPKDPPPEIVPYLEKHEISWELFSRRMVRDPEVKRIRSEVVTELHQQGKTWAQMTALTSFGAGQLRGYTRAVGCVASRKNLSEAGARSGRARKGEKKPWFSKQMKERWEKGEFDFHRGRVRSEEERQALRDSWTPERRAAFCRTMTERWANPEFRQKLERFHQDPKTRMERSARQAAAIKADPQKWSWGKGSRVRSTKSDRARFWVRSTFETAAVRLLEGDVQVASYEYEPVFKDEAGLTILPDFKVVFTDGSWKIVEVKASWVLRLPPEHPKAQKLARYRRLAERLGVSFEIWTEQDVLHDHL